MSRYFLASISVEGFRGINNNADPLVIKFKTDQVNSVHAPNGVGKSSIFEAIHFAIYGTVPRLSSMQADEDADSYLINKFHPGQKATVVLTFSSDSGAADVVIGVVRDASGTRSVSSPTGHADPEGFLVALREDFTLVDYTKFAKFIDASALDRGRSFAHLVGLSKYSDLRQNLERASATRNLNNDLNISSLETKVKADRRALGAIEQRLLSALNDVTGKGSAELGESDDAEAEVIKALRTTPLMEPFFNKLSLADVDFSAAEQAVEKEEGGADRKRLEVLTESVAALKAVKLDESDLEDGLVLVGMAAERDAAVLEVGIPILREVLRGALAVVDHADWHDPTICPVCDQSSPKSVKDHVAAKIAMYDAVAAQDLALGLAIDGSTFATKLGALEELKALEVPVRDRIDPALSAASKNGSVNTELLKGAIERIQVLEKLRAEKLDADEKELAALQAKLPPSIVQMSKHVALAKQARDLLAELRSARSQFSSDEANLAKLNRWKVFINAVSKSFGAAEATLTNDRIGAIQADCQTLFAKLVRGGPDMKPKLARSADSQHIDLQLTDFFGLPNLSARALLSESYRNAVAGAIFLSAALKHSGAARFVILDDVTSSFDAGHQFALMDSIRSMLRYGAVPDGIQFIILSHDASLEKYFDRLHGAKEWHHQKLQGMPPKGRIMISAQEAERLKKQAETYLNAGDVETGSPFLRQYMEYKFGQIISRLQMPVPSDYAVRGDKRTLSTYTEAITDAVGLYQKAGICVLTAGQITDLLTVHAPSILSNFVSHYETGTGSPFNAYALLGVIKSIDDFAECFMHSPTAGGAKVYYRRLDKK